MGRMDSIVDFEFALLAFCLFICFRMVHVCLVLVFLLLLLLSISLAYFQHPFH